MHLLVAFTVAAVWLMAQPSTPEYKLAAIQAGSPDDALVSQMSDALDSLGSKCTESRPVLADYTTTIRNHMALRGVDETPLSILQHVSAAIPDDLIAIGPIACDGIFALYYVARLDG